MPALSDIQKVRLLIGDQLSVAFTDDQIQTFLDLRSAEAGYNDQFYMAAYLGLKSLASQLSVKLRAGSTSTKIGDFETSTDIGSLSKAILDQAEGYRTLVEETPAFAVAEENLSPFSELTIIKNWIFRTQLP